MASNRKQPFGYKMEWGEIVIQEQEASVVRWIFQSYLTGASYNDLTEALEKGDVPYEVGKLWNKNMVARILENAKYTGQCDYPPLISQEQFDAVQSRRQKRAAPPRKTPAQKELRRLCGGSPPPWVERQVLAVLNGAEPDPGTPAPHILGLHIVEQIARAHGGRAVFAQNTPRGARCLLSLPLADVQAP